MNKKIRVARLSIISNSILIVLKLIVGLLSGSVSIISEAIHSFMDLLASVMEALLIFIAAFWIIYEAVKKIMHPDKTVREAHEICDLIEEDIKKAFEHTEVTSHVENF